MVMLTTPIKIITIQVIGDKLEAIVPPECFIKYGQNHMVILEPIDLASSGSKSVGRVSTSSPMPVDLVRLFFAAVSWPRFSCLSTLTSSCEEAAAVSWRAGRKTLTNLNEENHNVEHWTSEACLSIRTVFHISRYTYAYTHKNVFTCYCFPAVASHRTDASYLTVAWAHSSISVLLHKHDQTSFKKFVLGLKISEYLHT